jgi:hypothetical protein
LKKKTNQKNKPAGESVKPDQIIGVPFEDAVRRLLQTPPTKKSKPKEKKDSKSI